MSKTKQLIVIGFLCLFVTACAYTVMAEGDTLDISPPEGEEWPLANRFFIPKGPTGGAQTSEYVREGESIDDWTELFTTTVTYKDFLVSKQKMYNDLVEIREKNCPGSTRWNIIEEKDDRLVYEWWAKPCMGWSDQHEIGMIIDGRRDRFMARYTVMKPAMSDERRNQWVDIMTQATVLIPQ